MEAIQDEKNHSLFIGNPIQRYLDEYELVISFRNFDQDLNNWMEQNDSDK